MIAFAGSNPVRPIAQRWHAAPQTNPDRRSALRTRESGAQRRSCPTLSVGKVAEGLNASVLKTDVANTTGGSNPPLSLILKDCLRVNEGNLLKLISIKTTS